MILAGTVIGLLGFLLSLIEETTNFGAFGYYYPVTIHPYLFIGAPLVGIGINWLVGGLLLKSVNKDVADEGILLTVFFGAFGVLIWLVFSHPGSVTSTVTTYNEEPHRHCPNCNMMIPFYSVQFCPHCGKELIQNKPDYEIREVK